MTEMVSASVVDVHQSSQHVIRDPFENRGGRISEILRGHIVWGKKDFYFHKIWNGCDEEDENRCFLKVA